MTTRRIVGMDNNGYPGIADPSDVIIGDGSQLTNLSNQTDIAALSSTLAVHTAAIAALPAPASILPPAIGVSSALGNASAAYARADHTHASSVQRTVLTTDANGQATWTFPNTYTVAPVVEGTAVNTSGATQPYVTNLIGDPTLTSAKFQVFKAAPVTVSILGANVNIFSAVAAGIKVHVWAALPTQ